MAKVEAQRLSCVEAQDKEPLINVESQSDLCIVVKDKDFLAKFDENSWSVLWHWKQSAPASFRNKEAIYSVKSDIVNDFKKEVRTWIELGWLKEFEGDQKGLLPLMAVVQENKGKV